MTFIQPSCCCISITIFFVLNTISYRLIRSNHIISLFVCKRQNMITWFVRLINKFAVNYGFKSFSLLILCQFQAVLQVLLCQLMFFCNQLTDWTFLLHKHCQTNHDTLPPVLPSGELLWIYALQAWPTPGWLCANMASTRRLEVYIALSSEQNSGMTTVSCTENLMKFGHVVFEICEWTDIQSDITDKLTAILCTPSGGTVKSKTLEQW